MLTNLWLPKVTMMADDGGGGGDSQAQQTQQAQDQGQQQQTQDQQQTQQQDQTQQQQTLLGDTQTQQQGQDQTQQRTQQAPKPLTAAQLMKFYPENAQPKADVATTLAARMNEQGMNADQAEAIVKFAFGQRQRNREAATQRRTQQLETWKTELEGDPDILAGAGKDANLSSIRAIVKEYGGSANAEGVNELQKLLNDTGFGNHPTVARFLLRLTKGLVQEGGPTRGTLDSTAIKPTVDRLFTHNPGVAA